mmetsp:Transcript_6870/g.11589  ORF Transcript_6870/g.11589 Transcript_6870/m.11589 type:complete len:88 (-) Transcript_6870:657-920(-)
MSKNYLNMPNNALANQGTGTVQSHQRHLSHSGNTRLNAVVTGGGAQPSEQMIKHQHNNSTFYGPISSNVLGGPGPAGGATGGASSLM